MENSQKKILGVCFYAFFMNGIAALIIGAIMPAILEDLNMGYNQGGMLLSFQSIGNLIASFLSGLVFFYLGRKKGIVLLSSMSVIGFFAMTIVKLPVFLLPAFFLTGLGKGSVTNINNTIVNEVGNGRPGPMNILHTFFAIGAFMAPFFASWCFGMNLSWRFILSVVSAFALVMVILYSSIDINSTKINKKEKNNKEKQSFDFLKNISFYLTSGILFFYVGVEYAVNGWIVTYLKDTGIMTTTLAQKILSILWVIIIFGRLFVAYISKKVDKRTILLVSSTGVMVFFGLFLISSNIWAIVACILGLGFCLSGIYPTAVSNVGNVLKESTLAMGVLLGVAGLGGILMPYITGLVAEKVGIAGGMIAISVAVIFMFLFTLLNKVKGIRIKQENAIIS